MIRCHTCNVDFATNKGLQQHTKGSRHKIRTSGSLPPSAKYTCTCGKFYAHRQSFHVHKKLTCSLATKSRDQQIIEQLKNILIEERRLSELQRVQTQKEHIELKTQINLLLDKHIKQIDERELQCHENNQKPKSNGGGKRCPNCIDWIDSRVGSSAYDGYCATCFKHKFPSDERSKKVYIHTKEIMVRNHINSHFNGFIHDTPIYTGNCDCTHRRRIDHRKLIGNTILAIETDEFGHRGYDKTDEEIRYDDLYMVHSGKWIFIRFNPDLNVSKIDIANKLEKLTETIKESIVRIEKEENTELLEIIKLYC